MATREVTADNFSDIVANNDTVFLDFWASWCGPCQWFAPVFEQVAVQNPDIVFGKVNTEVERELAEGFNVMSIPTLAVLRDNVLIFSEAGALPEAALTDLVAKVREVDMDDVRRQLAEQQGTAASS